MTFDLNISGNPDTLRTSLTVDGSLCSGVQALMQQVMVLLLTDPDAPESVGFGTTFGQYLRESASNQSEEELRNRLNIALTDLTEQFRMLNSREPRTSLHSLDGAVNPDGGEMTVVINVVNKAGESARMSYPVTSLYQARDQGA